MNNLFRIIFLLSICFFAFNIKTNLKAEEKQLDTKFIITAYYSPLPNQDFYQTGSYEGDIKLNGKGINFASGKPVFEGGLAGPSNYPFGTKIYLEGYGVGVIEDRGGAIVKSGVRSNEYDRLDIWMGYGDEGLARAKKWGRKTISGSIVNLDTPISIKLGESTVYIPSNLQVSSESSEENIKTLQKIFKAYKLYNGEIDGKYESIKEAIINFQIKNGIIPSKDDKSAGIFGPKSRKTLEKIQKNIPLSEQRIPENFTKEKKENKKLSLLLDNGDLVIKPESSTENIKKLQNLLKDLGEYEGEIDGSFVSIKDTLVEIQVILKVIPNKNDEQAGYYGKRTKTALWSFYEKNPEKNIIPKTKTESLENKEKPKNEEITENKKEEKSNENLKEIQEEKNNPEKSYDEKIFQISQDIIIKLEKISKEKNISYELLEEYTIFKLEELREKQSDEKLKEKYTQVISAI